VPTGQVVPLARPELQQLTAAAAAFLAQPSLAASTRRSYQQTLDRLERELGAAQLLEDLTVEAVAAVCAAWSRCAPATWNRHVATLGSFVAYCHRHRWLTTDLAGELERRPEPADRTKAIPLAELERLWKRDDVAVREKALWRFLYETAARASEALAINVEDADLDNKRVPGPLQRWRSRLAPPPDRLGPAAPHADRRAPPRPAVPRRPRPRARPRARHGRPLPGDRPSVAVLPPRRGAIPQGLQRANPPPALSQCAHPPGRAEHQPAAADGQEPPRQPAVAAALRPPRHRGGGGAHRSNRPRPPASLSGDGVQMPVPTFSEQHLEAIAKLLGALLTGSEITRMLQQAEIYKDVIPDDTKWRRLLTAFTLQQRSDSSGTQVAWAIELTMSPVRYAHEPQRFAVAQEQLHRVLAFLRD
jgi:hypothetical protein